MNKENSRWYFSLVSGELYTVTLEEVSKQGSDKIPLSQKPNSNCKKCYDRMHIGQHKHMSPSGWVYDYYIPCQKCLKKYLNKSLINSETGKVEILQADAADADAADNTILTAAENEFISIPATTVTP